MSIEIKQKIKEVADDLKMPTKEVIEIVGKFYDKPKSSSQNLTEDQLNVIFDHITRNHHPEKIVVERNRDIVPAGTFAETALQDGDTLELLQFVGGG